MKLFQIEEPDGSPSDPEAPGAAVGIDVSGALAAVAIAVGGNAAILTDREGFERDLPAPGPQASAAEWQVLFEGAKLRAERGLARPATHAVVALAAMPERAAVFTLLQAAAAAGLEVMRVVAIADLAKGEPPAEAAAVMAEDMAPRPEGL